MDPTTNPTPSSNPAPDPMAGAGANSNPGVNENANFGTAGAPANNSGMTGGEPGVGAGPVAADAMKDPVMPGAAANPIEPVAPASSTAPASVTTSATSAEPVHAFAASGQEAPVNPIIQPSGGGVNISEGLSATDPIMRPEPAPAPDPVEEELKAPMKAAGPVPGSIGSAVSGPNGSTASGAIGSATQGVSGFGGQKAPQSVGFNDPATQPTPNIGSAKTTKPSFLKGTNKNTLIALIVVVAMIIIGLIAVLVFQMS